MQEVAENSLLSHSAKTKLLDAVKAARAELNSDLNDALDLINHISNESDKCVGSVEKVGVEPHPKRVGPAS